MLCPEPKPLFKAAVHIAEKLRIAHLPVPIVGVGKLHGADIGIEQGADRWCDIDGEILLAAISRGDLAGRITVNRRDEIGRMFASMNAMAEGLGELVSGIDERSLIIRTASDTLKSRTIDMARGATATVADVESVGRESRGVRVDAHLMEQDAASIAESARTTAVSAEQVSAATRDVSEFCEVQADLSRRATVLGNNVVSATHRMTESGAAIARGLGTIADIADQAQMASLAIVAAGDAEPSVSAAAAQVRRLVRQMAESSNEIQKTAGTFVESARQTGLSVGEMNAVLHTVETRTDTLFLTMKEQATAVATVSHRAADTLERIRAVSGRIHATAERTGIVDATVNIICTRTRESVSGLNSLLGDADSLARLSADMGALAGRFNLGTRFAGNGETGVFADTRVHAKPVPAAGHEHPLRVQELVG